MCTCGSGKRYLCAEGHTHFYFPALQMDFSQDTSGIKEARKTSAPPLSQQEKKLQQSYLDDCLLEMRSSDPVKLEEILDRAWESLETVNASREELTQTYEKYQDLYTLQELVSTQVEQIHTLWKDLYPLLQQNALTTPDTTKGYSYEYIDGHTHFYFSDFNMDCDGDASYLRSLNYLPSPPLSHAQIRVKNLYEKKCALEAIPIKAPTLQEILQYAHLSSTREVTVPKEKLTQIQAVATTRNDTCKQVKKQAEELENLWQNLFPTKGD